MENVNSAPKNFDDYIAEIKKENRISLSWKTLFQFLKICIYIVAITFIATSNEIILNRNGDRTVISFFLYILILFLSVIAIQYMVRDILFPLNLFANNEKKELLKNGFIYYHKSFYKGTIGFGYLIFIASLLPLIPYPITEEGVQSPHFNIFPGVFFVISGEIIRVKGAIVYLVYSYKKNKNT